MSRCIIKEDFVSKSQITVHPVPCVLYHNLIYHHNCTITWFIRQHHASAYSPLLTTSTPDPISFIFFWLSHLKIGNRNALGHTLIAATCKGVSPRLFLRTAGECAVSFGLEWPLPVEVLLVLTDRYKKEQLTRNTLSHNILLYLLPWLQCKTLAV